MVVVKFVKLYGVWSDIINFLEENEKHKEIFCKRRNISIDRLNKALAKEDFDFVLDLIDSDTDEITEILNEIIKDDEEHFFIVRYNEYDDVIVAEKWKIVKRGEIDGYKV